MTRKNNTPKFYKGYALLTVQYDPRVTPAIAVFNPRRPGKPVYTHPNVAGAKRWIDAYRAGTTWAVLAEA